MLGYTAKARGLEMTITFEEYCFLTSNPCHYCGGKLPPMGSGVDRLDRNKGYIWGNSVPCCGKNSKTKNKGNGCNFVKGCIEAAGFKFPRPIELMFELRNRDMEFHGLFMHIYEKGRPCQDNQ